MRRAALLVALLLALTAGGCPTKKGQDVEPKVPGAGRICEHEGDVAGHGGTVYHCRRTSDGRLIWRTK